MQPESRLSDETLLLRVLNSDAWYSVTEHGIALNSFAFSSVSSGITPAQTSCEFDNESGRAKCRQRFPGSRLSARFTTRQARDCGFLVSLDAFGSPEGYDPDHVVLTLAPPAFSKSAYQKASKLLSLAAEVVVVW